MRIGLQLLLGYVLVAIIACYLVFTIFLQEVKPTVKRATEGMLIDTATLLATIVSEELTTLDQVKISAFGEALTHINETPIQANIDGVIRNKIAYRVYITDKNGIVIFDSDKQDEGKDYSRWNDVYLTLKGKYGARTTKVDPSDPASSIMYVAAPIKIEGELVGVLTVAKPVESMSIIIDKGERRILVGGAILIGVASIIGLFFIWWINRSIKKLVNYAHQVSNHQMTVLPKLASSELRTLANALEDMRLKLDGKDYIEKYVHTLAHELKSPLSSIRAATEILQETTTKFSEQSEVLNKMKETQTRFLANIDRQTERMSQLIERMLQLARLESRAGINFESININSIVEQAIDSKAVEAQSLGIELIVKKNEAIKIKGDKFLLTQAISNLLSNALDFTPQGGEIEVQATIQGDYYTITVQDTGTGIPDYAINRIYERFYSLPRSNKGKSSGLGLAFVKEVAILHSGSIVIDNRTDVKGTIARLSVRIA